MSRLRASLVVCYLVGCGLASAHSITDEAGVYSQQPTAESPRSGALSDRLTGNFELSDAWALDVGLFLVHDEAVDNPDAGSGPYYKRLQQSAANVFQASVGTDWTPNDHWDLALGLNASPSSVQTTFTQMPVDGGTAVIPFKATNRSYGGTLGGTFTTAGDSKVETAVDANVAYTYYVTDERATGYVPPGGRTELTAQELEALCAGKSTLFCKFIDRLLRQKPGSLQEVTVGAGLTETLFRNTDLGLSGTYTFYSQDPTTIGFYSIMVAGRLTSAGAGIPIAPLQYTIRPNMEQRFGPFSMSLFYEYDQFIPGQGYGNVLGGKLQYKFTRGFKMYLTFSGAANRVPVVPGTAATPASAETELQHTGSLALGARWRF